MSDVVFDIEVDLLLEALLKRHGYDLRQYARASLRRRLQDAIRKRGMRRPLDLLPGLLDDPKELNDLLTLISVPVSEMFRDPEAFRAIRDEVLPVLETYPSIRVWVAGCATGEEAYSLAILLREAGLLHRSRIYATDINDEALAKAEAGVYPAKYLDLYSRNFLEVGGGDLEAHVAVGYDRFIVDAELRERVTFSHHNLQGDGVFAEAHLVSCRNTLIYFDRPLQDDVVGLLGDSLVRGGYLWLGPRESLEFSAHKRRFDAVSPRNRIFRASRDRTGGGGARD